VQAGDDPVRPLAIGPCAGPRAHEGHEVIMRSHPVPEGRPRGLLTLWRCPVDGWGGYWHDLARDPARDGIGGGPGLDALPARP